MSASLAQLSGSLANPPYGLVLFGSQRSPYLDVLVAEPVTDKDGIRIIIKLDEHVVGSVYL
jgi:hypothetical protein